MNSKWSYLAALIDGEGTISIGSRTSREYRHKFGIFNTNEELMRILVSEYSGHYSVHVKPRKANHKTCFIWSPKGKEEVGRVLELCSPLLVVKYEAASILSEFIAIEGMNPEYRETLYDRMLSVQLRGMSKIETISRRDNKKDWAYLAGLFDGEGTLSITYIPDGTRTISVCNVHIYNRSTRLMRWLISTFGGVYYPAGVEGEYVWKTKGQKNKETLLLSVLPYLKIKKEQANLLLQFLRTEKGNIAEKTRLCNLCMPLNGTGPTTNTQDKSKDLKIESDLVCEYKNAPLGD